jgi:hypothetical protein
MFHSDDTLILHFGGTSGVGAAALKCASRNISYGDTAIFLAAFLVLPHGSQSS